MSIIILEFEILHYQLIWLLLNFLFLFFLQSFLRWRHLIQFWKIYLLSFISVYHTNINTCFNFFLCLVYLITFKIELKIRNILVGKIVVENGWLLTNGALFFFRLGKKFYLIKHKWVNFHAGNPFRIHFYNKT